MAALSYAVENALFQWEEGERRLRDSPELERRDLEGAAGAVLVELRRRLGSSFSLEELIELYSHGAEWAFDAVRRHPTGTDAATVVDAAFNRYAREAVNYAGGRRRP